MANAPSDTSQKEIGEKAVPMRRHGNQIALDLVGKTENLIRGIATCQMS
jgi:hypothetical protein